MAHAAHEVAVAAGALRRPLGPSRRRQAGAAAAYPESFTSTPKASTQGPNCFSHIPRPNGELRKLKRTRRPPAVRDGYRVRRGDLVELKARGREEGGEVVGWNRLGREETGASRDS